MSVDRKSTVVIIGAGFGGLAAARGLRNVAVDVIVIDRVNHHTFQPLLYQVATAGLSAPQIASPIRTILRSQKNVRVLLGDAVSIDTPGKRVLLADGEVGFDYLIVATGLTHSYFGHDRWAQYAPGLKTLDDALEIRRRILIAFERAERESDATERAAWLTFVLIGGGPTGVELAGTLAEIARHTLTDEFRAIDPASARVLLVEGGSRILNTYPEVLSAKAARQLHRLGVEVRVDAPVIGVDGAGVLVQSKGQMSERINARTVLWAAGVQATALAQSLPGPRDRAGRVMVTPTLQVEQSDSIFVVGDLASVMHDGRPVPGVAYAAKQMGAYAAHAIASSVRVGGEQTATLAPFRYRDRGSLATIGRKSAVAVLPGGIRLSGLAAWWTWLLVHIFFLIGFRNRVTTIVDWMWAYLTYQRHARLILNAPTPMREHAAPPS
ncbi:MAG TPA: NAD(P)/FAD-dependent oxidoreductase [Burkholderiaceae bacterium]|nr:NAD(P)/FAD-dependent oxidoreductase [Burkholderiaceae bacterium]